MTPQRHTMPEKTPQPTQSVVIKVSNTEIEPPRIHSTHQDEKDAQTARAEAQSKDKHSTYYVN